MKVLQSNVVETTLLRLANGADTKQSKTVVLGKQVVKPLVQVTHKQKIARLILNEMSSLRVSNATDDVYDAYYRASIRNALANQKAAKECVQLGSSFKPEFANISFYGFGQTIMDAVCWSARNPQQMAKEEDLLDALSQNGISKSTDAAEEIGLDQSDIAGDVEFVFKSMSVTLSNIGSKLKMYNTQELYMFAPSVRDAVTGEWSTPFATNEWDEALNLMNETVERLKAGDLADELTEDDIGSYDPEGMGASVDHSQEVEDIALKDVEFKSALEKRKVTARKTIKHGAVSA
jgi:hypothetical protein